MIKNQDIVVLAVLMCGGGDKMTFSDIGKLACISVSEAHGAVKRLQESSLIGLSRRPIMRNVKEYLVHGLRYSFPLRPAGKLIRGMPTSYAAPVARDEFATTGVLPVWSNSKGTVYGQAFEPIYPTAPKAAAASDELYSRLALFDMLRGGRLRERYFAEKKLEEIINDGN